MRILILATGLAIAFGALAQDRQRTDPVSALQLLRSGVVVYDRADFDGTSETYLRDVPDLSRSRLGDDAARSVRVARGCRVRLYQEPNYGGGFVELNADTASLKDTPVGMSQTSSLQLRCGSARFEDEGKAELPAEDIESKREVAAGEAKAVSETATDTVTLYTGHGWQGTSRSVQGAVPDLRATEVGYDARSIRIAEGCSAQVFPGTNFSGQMTELYRSVSNLGATRIRSVVVRCGAPVAAPAAAASTVTEKPAAEVSDRGVTLFDTPNYQGASETFVGDVPDLRRSRFRDDAARSVAVAEGCWAELYELSNYRGSRSYVDGSLPTLANTPVGNNAVSSIRVQCGIDECADVDAALCVTLFAGFEYEGQSETFGDDVPDLRRRNFGDRRARSLRVSSGCTAELYSQPDYGGDSQSFTRNESRLDRTRFGADRASSLRFYCSGAQSTGGVILYEDRAFGGQSERFERDVRDLGETALGRDRASSVRVDAGCRAWLYDGVDYRGNFSLVERDEPSLRDLTIGSDHVRSLRVECGG